MEERYFQHTSGKGSLWTKLHRPIKIEKKYDDCDIFDEDKYVKKYMAMYGIDKVRGGSYVTEKLNEEQIKTIQKEINASMDLCVNCGNPGHFIKDCNLNKDFHFNKELLKTLENDKFACQFCKKEFDSQKGKTYHENIHCKSKNLVQIKTCFECNKTGHYSNECPNKVETFSCQYCDKQFETQKGATYHENFYCKNKVEIFLCQYCDKEFETQKGATFHENVHCSKKKNKLKANKCFTCGREGHYAEDCYATRHVKGYEI
jgi:hypothetical protein